MRRLSVPCFVLGLAACASASHTNTSGPPRWTGDLRKLSGYNSAMMVPGSTTAQASAYGSVTLTPAGSGHTLAELSVTVPNGGDQYAWAVLTGPCGSPGPTVTGPNEFPVVDIGPSGSATLRATLPFELDEHATYHVNLYNGPRITSDQGSVMMCASLERSGSR